MEFYWTTEYQHDKANLYANHGTALPGLPALPQNVARKAKLEHWNCQPRLGRGGGYEYAYTSLPRQTQTALLEKEGQAIPIAHSRIDSSALQRVQAHFKTTIEQRTDAWLAILRTYEAWRANNTFSSQLQQDLAFVQAYHEQQLDLPIWVYLYLPKLSRSSLKAKQRLRRDAPKITALGGNYGQRRGKGRIDADLELQSDIKACLAAGGKH